MVDDEDKSRQLDTILLVDDDSINLAVFGQHLMANYAVLVATSGVRAIEIAKGEPKPDLILLDIMMPAMDGYEVIDRLKACAETCDIPVIFVTALTSDLDESQGFKLGAVDYIYKPCNLAILSARVATHIELKKARDRLLNQNAYLEKELEKRLRENQLIQLELLQSEKLAAIGQLAAGIAHEINNPLGFIHSNFNTLDEYSRDIFALLDVYDEKLSQARIDSGLIADLQASKKQKDLDFLREDMASLIAESKDGVARVRNIIQNLQKFSEGNNKDWQLADMNECLDTTLEIFTSHQNVQYTTKRLYTDLPAITCLPARLNQMFLSLLLNASQAIDTCGEIVIRTGADAKQVWVEIIDNGHGIKPEHLTHLFEPFFTTRPLGKGIGLGLSTAQSIVQAHHGKIEVASILGEGSTFKVILPISQSV